MIQHQLSNGNLEEEIIRKFDNIQRFDLHRET